MLRVASTEEPERFDSRCRQRGRCWLQTHPQGRPVDYWSEFNPDLHHAFTGRCGYCAMTIMKGEVDHFIPVASVRGTPRECLIYEWNNFRYADPVLNRYKSNHQILDPFEVRNDWFEMLLPSLQLVMTDAIPQKKRKLADFTLNQLRLCDGEVMIRYRQMWFEMYRRRQLLLTGLQEHAPQIARAVERDLNQGIDWRHPAP